MENDYGRGYQNNLLIFKHFLSFFYYPDPDSINSLTHINMICKHN